MLEQSFGLNFFLKPSTRESNSRYLYLRVTVDGIRKETSTKRKWDYKRWDAKSERAIGTKEDARAFNHFIETMVMKINQFKMDLMYSEKTITSQRIIDFLLGRVVSKALLLEEFQSHNDEMFALVPADYALATYKRYHYTREHVKNFIAFKFTSADIELRDLDYDFISNFELYLKTVRKCNNNSTLKYISCLRKIIYRAMDKSIIPTDPFRAFKRKKTKTLKNPLSLLELIALEKQSFSTQRLSVVRDIFVFQCYTGLAYVDVYHLRNTDIGIGVDGKYWILSSRHKTGNETNIPLLPKALELVEKYKDHPVCLQRGAVLPVSSNQKMNEYLKEIATLCGLDRELNTHLARHTFATTITLTNGVPIETVSKMLGHSSIRTTQVYAKVIEQKIGEDMDRLNERLAGRMLPLDR